MLEGLFEAREGIGTYLTIDVRANNTTSLD